MALNLWDIQYVKNFICITFIIVITQHQVTTPMNFRALTYFMNVSCVISSRTSEQASFQLWHLLALTIFLCEMQFTT
jgi:hypothetical protein